MERALPSSAGLDEPHANKLREMCQTRGTKSLQRATGIDRDPKTQNSTRQQLLNVWDFEERKLNGAEKRERT
jgi:hypothetical protein